MKKVIAILSLVLMSSTVFASDGYEIISVVKGGFWRWTSAEKIKQANEEAKQEMTAKCESRRGKIVLYQFFGSNVTLDGRFDIHQAVCQYSDNSRS